jgi:hypothetical protein
MIYEVLSFEGNFGVGVYTDRKLANTMCNLIFKEISGFETLSVVEKLADKHQSNNLLTEILLLFITMSTATDIIHMMQKFNLLLVSNDLT